MKLGVFDSGLGGLLMAKSIRERFPDFDMVYFGDTLHVPYGNRSRDAIYRYTVAGIEFLFSKGCGLVVLACNTASANALRDIQQAHLPGRHNGKNVLGIVVPTLEAAIESGIKNIGLLGTRYSVQSNAYGVEIEKLSPDVKLHQVAAPLLVPLIENDGERWAEPILQHYLGPLKEKKIEALILACTHYPFLKKQIQKAVGPDVKILSQDEIIADKLQDYLERHTEYNISRNGSAEYYVSDLTESYEKTAEEFYGQKLPIELVTLPHG